MPDWLILAAAIAVLGAYAAMTFVGTRDRAADRADDDNWWWRIR